MKKTFMYLIIAVAISTPCYAHSGKTNSEGCHTNKKTGEYHCHNGGGKSTSQSKPSSSQPSNPTPDPSSTQKYKQVFNGKVVGVSDGDTITVLTNNVQHKIRLHGVDCPESKQAFGTKAKQFTSNLVFGKLVTVKVVEKDRYERLVAEVIIGEKNLGYELVKAGMAWHYKQYSDDEKLSALELEARGSEIGIWSDPEPQAPWEWRKEQRAD